MDVVFARPLIMGTRRLIGSANPPPVDDAPAIHKPARPSVLSCRRCADRPGTVAQPILTSRPSGGGFGLDKGGNSVSMAEGDVQAHHCGEKSVPGGSWAASYPFRVSSLIPLSVTGLTLFIACLLVAVLAGLGIVALIRGKRGE